MKKFSIFINFLLAFGLVTPALALGVNTSVDADVSATVNVAPRTTGNAEVQNNIRAGMMVQLHDERGQFRAEVAKTRVVSATQVVRATISRLQRIIVRIESRMTKVQASGGATVTAKADVDAAKLSLNDAQAQLTAILALDLSTTSTTTAAANFETIKADAAKARLDLESARQNLLKAVISLQGEERKHPGMEASTTVNASATIN